MSGIQRRARCSQNSARPPAVVCPLDGGVSRHGVLLLADSTVVATARRLRLLHATDATRTAAGMGRTADAGLGARTKQRRRCVLAGPGRRTSVAPCAEALTIATQTAELLRTLAQWCAGRRRTDSPAQRLRKLSLPRTRSALPNSAFVKHEAAFYARQLAKNVRLHVTANVRHERHTTARTLLPKRRKATRRCMSARWRCCASPPRKTVCHSCWLLRPRFALHGVRSSCSRFSRRKRCVHKPHGPALRLTLTLACLLRAAHADAAARAQRRGLCCAVHRACNAAALAVALPKRRRCCDDRCCGHDTPLRAMREQREQLHQPARAMHRLSAGYALHRTSLARREAQRST
jgi:hypothetical protein